MFPVSHVTGALWRLTGLPTSVSSSGLSATYAMAVYVSYACSCAAFVAFRSSAVAADETAGKLSQIRLIRDADLALLFAATTAVYWCGVARRREHADVHEQHAAVARRLFGTAVGPSYRVLDACFWALYALMAVALSLEAYRYAGTARWAYTAVVAWGHYSLLTGNMQFAAAVFALHRCYCELNERMRSGGTAVRRDRCDAGLRTVSDSKLSTPSVVGPHDVTVISVLDKVNLLTMLKYWSDLHWSITQIVSRFNNLFKFRLFIFFVCGLLHLIMTPYLLSLTILNEDIDILSHIIERTLWFILHILRVVLMIYPCALLGEEAAKTKILLGSYLSTKIDFYDIKKVETYAQQLDANKPEFSIYSMFVVDRQLVITLTGAVATYLVIILQLQDT